MDEQWTMPPTWPGAIDISTGAPKEDWVVVRNGVDTGRIYRRQLSRGREAYAWFLNKLHTINVNVQGESDLLDEAKAEFRRAWERAVAAHGIEKLEAALTPDGWRAYQKAHRGAD